MKKILIGLLALVSLAWGWDLLLNTNPSGGSLLWTIRQEGLYLTGLYSIALMSLSMLLATRPTWLERPLGGMDQVYRLHKWSGILAISFAAAHWLVEWSSDLLKATIGREGRIPKERLNGFWEVLRDLAEDMGEWAIYAVLAMLVITLWKRFPYQIWRLLHKVMPVLYLMLVFHAALLSPLDYWVQPVGGLMALLMAGGVMASVLSLTGLIGRPRQVAGTIASVNSSAGGVTEVTCQLKEGWKGHRPGQFAFITFNRLEGAHPFTIASADRTDRTITFQIKALGNYTRGLAARLHIGQTVKVEGPYGRFNLARCNPRAQQLWIAGGIGVTPFLAWLEALQADPKNAPAADLHYCTRDSETDSFVARLTSLCATLPGIQLHVHGSQQGESLTAQTLVTDLGRAKRAEIWFCGPQGLATALKNQMTSTWRGKLRFHQEAFEMR